MKTTVSGKQNNNVTTHPQTKAMNRPDNKNNLDSREGEEQLDKGDDVTHNTREKHSEGKSKK